MTREGPAAGGPQRAFKQWQGSLDRLPVNHHLSGEGGWGPRFYSEPQLKAQGTSWCGPRVSRVR